MEKFSLLVLAAGEGKRMRSRGSKVAHSVCQKEMVNWVLDEAKAAGAGTARVVVGHCAEQVKEVSKGRADGYALQAEQKGTGHAVMQAREALTESEHVMILPGDTPLITRDTLRMAMEEHLKSDNAMTVLTTELEDATGYGRIVRGADGSVERIVEHKDASEAELALREINSGMYCFKSADLLRALDRITDNNAQAEYYLTDALAILKGDGLRIGAYLVPDEDEVRGVNDRVQLAEAAVIMQRRINRKLALAGVTLLDMEHTYIGADVQIGMDTIVYPNAILAGNTVIGEGVTIGPNCKLTNAVIGGGTDVMNSTIVDSEVGKRTHVGPYAYIRPNCKVGDECRIGDFVELKNAKIGDKTKVSHLTYIGDAKVGDGVNFGCGTVVSNYDGQNKYETVIGDHAFIGCNTNLVAPVKVHDGAYIAAGSTITEDVPKDALAIARARQIVKEDWKKRY